MDGAEDETRGADAIQHFVEQSLVLEVYTVKLKPSTRGRSKTDGRLLRMGISVPARADTLCGTATPIYLSVPRQHGRCRRYCESINACTRRTRERMKRPI